jgi:hypothetical protein
MKLKVRGPLSALQPRYGISAIMSYSEWNMLNPAQTDPMGPECSDMPTTTTTTTSEAIISKCYVLTRSLWSVYHYQIFRNSTRV